MEQTNTQHQPMKAFLRLRHESRAMLTRLRVSRKSSRDSCLSGNVSTRQHISKLSSVCSRQGFPPMALTSRSFLSSPMRPNARIFSSHAKPGSPFCSIRSQTFPWNTWMRDKTTHERAANKHESISLSKGGTKKVASRVLNVTVARKILEPFQPTQTAPLRKEYDFLWRETSMARWGTHTAVKVHHLSPFWFLGFLAWGTSVLQLLIQADFRKTEAQADDQTHGLTTKKRSYCATPE